MQDLLQKIVLDSGFTVCFRPLKHSSTVAVGLFHRNGSLVESDKEEGYFHFLEHMLFKDSETRNAHEIAREIERVGGILNGSTSQEYTEYYVVCGKESTELALDILSDMVFRPKLLEKDIELEKGVVIEEMQSYEDDPDEFVTDFYFRNFYKGSAYGKDIIGNRESVTQINRKKLRTFYEKHYTYDNFVLAVSGNISLPKLLELVNKFFPKAFQKLPKISILKSNKNLSKPKWHLTKNWERRKTQQFNLLLGVPGKPRVFDEVTKLQTISTILGNGMSSRLFQSIREKEGLCYSIFSFPTFFRKTGLFSISCATSNDKAIKCVSLILREIEKVQKHGFTSKELEDAKSNQLGSMALMYERPESRMNQAGLQEVYYNRFFTEKERSKALKALTLEELNESVKSLFEEGKFQLSCVGNLTESQFQKLPGSL